MEKVKIKSAVSTGKKWQDKDIVNVTLEDGRSGSCMDTRILGDIGKELEMEVKPGKEYKGVAQYYFNYPKAASGNGKGGGFAGKNWAKENRVVALQCATNSIIRLKEAASSDDIIKLAEKYETWLNRA